MKKNYKAALKRIIKNQKSGLSFASDELIFNVQDDIYEFGANQPVAVWVSPKHGFVEDYSLSSVHEELKDLINKLSEGEIPTDDFWSVHNPEDIYVMELFQLLALLEFQNTILPDYSIVSRKSIKKQASKAASGFWASLSDEERSAIARERGKAGAAKRWGKVEKK